MKIIWTTNLFKKLLESSTILFKKKWLKIKVEVQLGKLLNAKTKNPLKKFISNLKNWLTDLRKHKKKI